MKLKISPLNLQVQILNLKIDYTGKNLNEISAQAEAVQQIKDKVIELINENVIKEVEE